MPQTASSPESEIQQETAVVSQTDVNTEQSSSSEGVETPSYFDAVEAALGKGKEASPTSEDGEEQAPKPDAQAPGAKADEGEPEELTEDEIKSYPPNSQRRIRQLVAQRDDHQRQVESLRPRAEQWDTVTSYMRENGIQPAEFDNALEITRIINSGDFSRALQVLTPIYREVAARAGEILPKDLAEEVRLGRISEQHARELNRTRATAQNAQVREQRTREQSEATRNVERVTQIVNSNAQAVDVWAKAKAGSDPDWSEKQKDVAEALELELNRLGPQGYPQTREAAIELAEKCLKVVEDRIKRYRPKPQARNAVTGQFASPKAKTKPTSYMDAIDQALGN